VDLILSNLPKVSQDLMPSHYKEMLCRIKENYPVIQKATSNFHKTQSQFMDNMFSVHQLTELRSARQILAEIKKSKLALDEAYYGLAKKQIEIRKKEHSLLTESLDEFSQQLLEVEISELKNQTENIMDNVQGALRRISGFMEQYQNILKKYGKEEFTEEDFEEDEERYHIMKVFEQALCAARSHGGVIDEGNHIYLFQIGVPGTLAQYEVTSFLVEEGKMIQEYLQTGLGAPDHSNTVLWLQKMAQKFSGCSSKYAEHKGITLISRDSLHKEES